MSMFCYQCQETAKGVACEGAKGVCGITADVVHLQDLSVYLLKGISIFSTKARELGVEEDKVNQFVIETLFKTITNGNFSADVFVENIHQALKLRDTMRLTVKKAGGKIEGNLHDSATWYSNDLDEINAKAVAVHGKIDAPDEDTRSLRALTLYGLKGLAAYQEHAFQLGHKSDALNAFVQNTMVALTNDAMSLDENIALVLETGKFGVDVMALLDKANTIRYGNPKITNVNIGVSNKPGILISGHDLRDMEDLLKQTDGTGVDVYTHSEMLPAHYYPEFKKYKHFVGNYGNAWWKQNEEFESFNGPVLFTTNCIVPPKKSNTYANRVYTTGISGFPGFKHIPERKTVQLKNKYFMGLFKSNKNTNKPVSGMKDFSEIIEHAKKCQPPVEIETGEIVGGFAHNQVLQLADKVVDAVKSGAIRKFFVMAGCDGRMKNRSYYTEFAKKLPNDTVILTAGCAKYRYNKLPLGDIGGIPRVLDAGQCNDSYSLAVIAMKLKEVFELNDINELPIAYNIAWYEQKAVIVLLALLHLGVKNIHLGPTLPAFLSPNVVKVLVENFGIAGINTVDEDLKLFLN